MRGIENGEVGSYEDGKGEDKRDGPFEKGDYQHTERERKMNPKISLQWTNLSGKGQRDLFSLCTKRISGIGMKVKIE